jgi:hypothetical protein
MSRYTPSEGSHRLRRNIPISSRIVTLRRKVVNRDEAFCAVPQSPPREFLAWLPQSHVQPFARWRLSVPARGWVARSLVQRSLDKTRTIQRMCGGARFTAHSFRLSLHWIDYRALRYPAFNNGCEPPRWLRVTAVFVRCLSHPYRRAMATRLDLLNKWITDWRRER